MYQRRTDNSMAKRKKRQKNTQYSTKQYTETKDLRSRAPPKTGSELICSERISSSYLTCGTCRFTVKRHEYQLI